jgi:signal transduction histidine kinase/DNA-binding response OmpR family regulator
MFNWKYIDKNPMNYEHLLDVLASFDSAQLNGGKPFEIILNTLLEITGSKLGYIASISYSETSIAERNPRGKFLSCIAIHPPVPTDELCLMYENPNSIFNIANADKSIRTMDLPKYLQEHYGRHLQLPKNHPPVKTLATIPLLYEDKLIGHIGLANGPDYTILDRLDMLIQRVTAGLVTLRLKQCYDQITVEQSLKQTKNIVLANISHELRTPLNTILGMNALLLETDLDDNQYECLLVERKSCYHLLGLITDILDINKLEAGKMVFKLMPVDVYELVETSYDLIGFESKRKDLQITYDIASNVPDNIIGDKQRIKQMLGNLLSNAVKFTPNGSITTKVEVMSAADIYKKGLKPTTSMNIIPTKKLSTQTVLYEESFAGTWNYIKFSVADTGIGIRDDDIVRLFKSYEQLETSNTKKNKGTGLGLAITYELCTLMGGKIFVESTIDKGSTFYFIIPLQTYNNPEKELDLSILENKTFLVVDDNEKNLTRLTDLLDSWGVDYRECSSSRRALSYVNKPKYKFDLGLLDIVMPVMDGNTLAERISRSDTPFPLIALSSDDGENAVSDFFAHHLTKPYEDKHLLETIIQVLKLQSINNDSEQLSSSSPSSSSPSPSSDDKYRRVIAVSSSGDEGDDLDEQCEMAIAKTSPTRKISKSLKNTAAITHTVKMGSVISGLGMRKTTMAETPQRQPTRTARAKKLAQHKRMQMDNFYERAENVDINILLVEDQEFNSIMLSKMLKNIGYHNIDFATSGEQAIMQVKANKGVPLKKGEKSKYDLILMDIIMPGKYDGVDAAKRIHKLFKHGGKPKIVAVTASVFDGAVEQYLIEGQMDGYITKPIDKIKNITDCIRNLGFV